jgi:hypothetical protein
LLPLPKHKHLAILDLVRANELDESQLACHMTRQQASGRGYHPNSGGISGPAFNISYNLLLCEYCGNLNPRAHCPAKMRDLATKWLHE